MLRDTGLAHCGIRDLPQLSHGIRILYPLIGVPFDVLIRYVEHYNENTGCKGV